MNLALACAVLDELDAEKDALQRELDDYESLPFLHAQVPAVVMRLPAFRRKVVLIADFCGLPAFVLFSSSWSNEFLFSF